MSSQPPRNGTLSSKRPLTAHDEDPNKIHEPPTDGENDLHVELPADLPQSKARPLRSTPTHRRSHVEFVGDRAALVNALRRGDEGAAAALFHEYATLVERTIGRILGVDNDLPDATQDVFLRALRSVHRLRDPQALTDWLLQITVCTATDWVRKRKRKRWLLFFDPTDLEHPPSQQDDEQGREAVRATYAVLDRMSVEERTVFALRHIDGMELLQLAQACDCSLATVKRRLNRANARFEALARHEPSLLQWLQTQDDDANCSEEQPS
jgi:RNA polymerase sigma-70 factor (ECF subfamily)